MPAETALMLGQRMYREGLAPSGEPMQSLVKGEAPVLGTVYTCLSCHLRGGLGSIDGDVKTPPINGPKLYELQYWHFPNLTPTERIELGVRSIVRRPAYTDETLAKVLRTGIDPNGREQINVMPRYILADQEMAVLIAYLKVLSSEFSPGVTATDLRFAAVITDEVSPEDRAAMLAPLDNYVAYHNTLSGGFGNRMYKTSGGMAMTLGYRKLSLARWTLKGPPATWTRQLEAYQRKEPVFALLGGISYGSWQPIHAFCEAQQLPCLFPITGLPVISEKDWYTLYFSKGYYQEGQATARYLASQLDPSGDPEVVQIARDTPEGRALSDGFRETWSELGREPVRMVTLKKQVKITPDFLRKTFQPKSPSAVLLWTGADAYPALKAIAKGEGSKSAVYMSSSYLKKELRNLPESARAFTYFTYPYRHPNDEPKYAQFANSLIVGLKNTNNDSKIYTRSYTLIQLLRQALGDLDRNYYRDTLLDVVGGLNDLILPDYERLSFGPGQRYASKGCYIMQLSTGEKPELVKKSSWVIH